MKSPTPFDRIASAYEIFRRFTATWQSPLLVIIRLYWGWQFAQTGWGKLQHIPRVTGFFASLGIPFPHLSAVGVSALELTGGILLIVGFGSRFTALLLAVDMIVAYLTAGLPDLLSLFSNPGKFYGDDAFTFLFSSILILIFGPGKFCLDQVILSRCRPIVGAYAAPAAHVGHAAF